MRQRETKRLKRTYEVSCKLILNTYLTVSSQKWLLDLLDLLDELNLQLLATFILLENNRLHGFDGYGPL